MNEKKAKYIAVPFLIMLFMFFFINILMPDKIISASENRNLEKKPTIKDIKEGSFPSKFEKYYTDQFVLREEMMSMNRMFEAKLDKSIVGNYYLGKDNWILGMFPKILTSQEVDKYANSINELAQISHDRGKDVYFNLTPHKTNMLRHLYPKLVDNKENIDINKKAFQSRLNANNIKFLDIDRDMLGKFSGKELERLYFKTDHHWKGTGAFEGFKLMAQKMNLGISSEELQRHFNQYKTKEYKEKDFVGSYNRNLNMVVKEREYPSYVYLENQTYQYFLNDGKKDKPVKEEDVIATHRDKNKWDYGGAYIRGNVCNILKIKNDNALIDKKILVFRDSYQAPTTLMFADLFTQVQFVDPRNIENIDMSYEEIIQNTDSDMVMFMYNSSGFDSMIQNMMDKGIH
ncbi:DHHW family protein [Irregularibacter muris]|uniref:DHHW family protein n=1 Tax=Irregularibacter muris TaxID=1796619 RepID=A0AAE3KZP7_9FIRM|nr:DHHW family protein [Irregularibacter muris]MCR1898592.1 DHHW family protein [Irregularibacter muris]